MCGQSRPARRGLTRSTSFLSSAKRSRLAIKRSHCLASPARTRNETNGFLDWTHHLPPASDTRAYDNLMRARIRSMSFSSSSKKIIQLRQTASAIDLRLTESMLDFAGRMKSSAPRSTTFEQMSNKEKTQLISKALKCIL